MPTGGQVGRFMGLDGRGRVYCGLGCKKEARRGTDYHFWGVRARAVHGNKRKKHEIVRRGADVCDSRGCTQERCFEVDKPKVKPNTKRQNKRVNRTAKRVNANIICMNVKIN